MTDSHLGSASMIGSTFPEMMLLETQTFCVVCGRFGSDFVLRKSGLKCSGCVGKMANKEWVRLQHRQASELLSHAAARARQNCNGSVFPLMFGSSRCGFSSVMDSEECGSSPTDHSIAHEGGNGETRMAPVPPSNAPRKLIVPHLDEGLNALGTKQEPHIMEYITNTTCYQAAAVGVRAPDPLSSTSNTATSSMPDTSDEIGLKEMNVSLVSSVVGRQVIRRKAPAVPPRASRSHAQPCKGERKKSPSPQPKLQIEKEQKEKEEEEEVQEVKKVENKVVDGMNGETSPEEGTKPASVVDTDAAGGGGDGDDNMVPSISEANPVQHLPKKTGQSHPRETVVREVDTGALCASVDDEASLSYVDNSLQLPPLLQPDMCGRLPKTPRADDFMSLPDTSSTDFVNREGSPERQKSSVSNVSPSLSEAKRNRSSTHRTGAVPFSFSSSAISPGRNSLRSSLEGGRNIAPPVFALSKNTPDVGGGRKAHVRTVSPVTGRKMNRLQQQKQKQQQKQNSCADAASRQFERCNAISGEPVIYSSSSSGSSSSASSASLNSRDAIVEPQTSLNTTSRHKVYNAPMEIKQPLCVNIDRLYVAVELTQPTSLESPRSSAIVRVSSSSSSNASATHATAVPVPSAPGSKFTVTRHFSSRHSRYGGGSSFVTQQGSIPRRCSSAGSVDTASRRKTNRRSRATPPEGVEANSLSFMLFVRDRDTKVDLYSLKRRYFFDLAPIFQELKSLMNTLPPLPVRRVPSTRYVTDSFVAERRAECQTFLDAVVQNHFLIRHPNMVQLLRLEPYLQFQNESELPMGGGIAHSRDDRKIVSARGLSKNLERMSSQLNVDALKRLGSVPNLTSFRSEISSSSYLSTTSSVARCGVMDAIGREDLEKVQLGDRIGRGTFGTVYMGLLPGSSAMVAVKVLHVSGNFDEEFLLSMIKELDVLRAARHKNIIRFLGCTYLERERELRVFTEFVECGNICTMVKKFGCLPLLVIQKYMTQILRGLEYLHNMAIVHRDIKGENILVTKKGRCKLADFGCSGTLHELEGREEMQGSPLWMAPEIIHGASPATAGDIWAVGCVGIEMLQRPIWNIDGDLNPYIFLYRVGKLNQPPHGLPTEEELKHFNTSETREEYGSFTMYRDFLCCCLRVEAEERWSAAALLKHSFLQKPISRHLRWMPPKNDTSRTAMGPA